MRNVTSGPKASFTAICEDPCLSVEHKRLDLKLVEVCMRNTIFKLSVINVWALSIKRKRQVSDKHSSLLALISLVFAVHVHPGQGITDPRKGRRGLNKVPHQTVRFLFLNSG